MLVGLQDVNGIGSVPSTPSCTEDLDGLAIFGAQDVNAVKVVSFLNLTVDLREPDFRTLVPREQRVDEGIEGTITPVMVTYSSNEKVLIGVQPPIKANSTLVSINEPIVREHGLPVNFLDVEIPAVPMAMVSSAIVLGVAVREASTVVNGSVTNVAMD